MSVIKFELKKEHVNLVRHIGLILDDKTIKSEGDSPFGGFNHHEDMGIILYGRPDKFDPFEGDPFVWTDEQKEEMDTLLEELPTAIEIMLYLNTFEPGNYKTKFHDKNWKKIK